MSETTQPVNIMSASESWDLLASTAIGRLVTSVDGQPEIFPSTSLSSIALCCFALRRAPS